MVSIKRKPKKEDAAEPDKKGKGSGGVKLAKGKKEHFSLFVGDDGAILIYMEGNTVVRRLFAPTAAPEHSKTMIELMAQHPKAAVRIVMDVIDQQYIRQTFPPVSPLSVGGLAQRRLNRDFAAEDLKGAIRLGREATVRKDWIYMLVALSNTTNFQQWLDLIIEQPNKLVGIFLLPLECEAFISALGDAMPDKPEEKTAWQLLISHNKVSGFRIVVLRDGKLTFSRIGQAVGEAVAAVLAGNIEQEIQNTIEYIRRLGYSEGAGLEIFSISSAEVRDSIDSKRINATRLNLLSPFDVAEVLGLKQAALAADRFGDVVLAAALSLIKKSPLLLKPAYAKKLDLFYNARIGIRVFAGLVILLMLYMTSQSVIAVFSSKSKVKELEASFNQGRPTLDVLHRQVDQLGVDVNWKSDLVVFFDTIKPQKFSPIDVLDDVAKLQRNNVSIEEWEWSGPASVADGASGAAPAASAANGEQKFPVEVKAKAQLLGSFPDNQTILETVTNYKLYLTSNIKNYEVEIPSADVAGGSKISVAINGEEKQSASDANQATTLNIELHGPRTADTTQTGGAPNAGATP